MKITKLKMLVPALALSVVAVGVLGAPKAFAATNSWTDASGDHKFSTAANWSAGVPANGDDLVFDSATIEAENDIVGATFNSITFQGIVPAFTFTLSGEAFSLTGGMNNSVNDVLVENDITLSGNQMITSTGGLSLAGALNGSGNLTKAGDGVLLLWADNSAYTGLITVNAGDLAALDANALGDTASGTVVNDGADLLLGGCTDVTFDENITLSGASADAANGKLATGCIVSDTENQTITLQGTLTLASDVTFEVFNGAAKVTGPITGNFNLTLLAASVGKLTISSNANQSKTANGTYPLAVTPPAPTTPPAPVTPKPAVKAAVTKKPKAPSTGFSLGQTNPVASMLAISGAAAVMAVTALYVRPFGRD